MSGADDPYMDGNPMDALTGYRLSMIEKTLSSISDSIKQLANLEQRHSETRESMARAFTQIDAQDKRIKAIEMEMPTIKLVRGWIIAGVLAVFGILGLTFVKIVLVGEIFARTVN